MYPFLKRSNKQLVIEQYSGGMHCCFTNWIIELSSDINILYNSQDYNVGYGIKPLNLDNDEMFEFTTTILSFDYFHLPHGFSPLPEVLFKYNESKKKYLPANHIFPEFALANIEEIKRDVQKYYNKVNYEKNDEMSDMKYFSLILEILVRYVYSGKRDIGWTYYEKWYISPTKDEMKTEIQNQFDNCAIYRYIYD